MIHRFVQSLARRPFAQAAMAEKADLSAFRKRPTFRVLAGVFAIAFSYVLGWPLISFLGILSAYFCQPLLLVIGGPVAYGCSHLVFLLGMYLAGARYSWIFLRWATRVGVETLLKKFPSPTLEKPGEPSASSSALDPVPARNGSGPCDSCRPSSGDHGPRE